MSKKDLGKTDANGSFDAYGHNHPEPYDGAFVMPEPPKKEAHIDVDNDDLRKQANRYNHGSYRK